jgi:hypothetical protein
MTAFRRADGNTAGAKETFGTQDAVKPQVVKQVPLEHAARETAGTFILTAVARKNLDQAWKLATPNIKGGLSFKEWMAGNIPVPTLGVPIDKAAITKIIYSHNRRAARHCPPVPSARPLLDAREESSVRIGP